MPTLPLTRIAELLAPYGVEPAPLLLEKLSAYLDLLLKWNERTNLTAIRDAKEIVGRHFGESLYAARYVPAEALTLLDLGSGAGFPGLPIQLARPGMAVTLAESQNKKAAFLREAVRVLEVPVSVHGGRAETLVGVDTFDVVTMRAVDQPEVANSLARQLVRAGGTILHLARESGGTEALEVQMPGSVHSVLRILKG